MLLITSFSLAFFCLITNSLGFEKKTAGHKHCLSWLLLEGRRWRRGERGFELGPKQQKAQQSGFAAVWGRWKLQESVGVLRQGLTM